MWRVPPTRHRPFLGKGNVTCYHVNESTRNNRRNGNPIETIFSMRLVLEPYKYEWLHFVVGGDKKGNLKSETVKYDRESHGIQTWDWMCWRGPAAIVNDWPILLSERMLYKDYGRRSSIEKKNSGRESQGAPRQDELIGGKPPVVK
jgi:hypothetical protein